MLNCTTETAPDVFADITTTQAPGYQTMMVEQLRTEFAELTRLIEYGPLMGFFHPRINHPGIVLGTGNLVVSAIVEAYQELGGVVVKGNCFELVMDGTTCAGLHYRNGEHTGQIRCGELVLASGGFCGLFADGVGDNPGTLLGTYARHGGRLANLEWFNRFALADIDRRRPLYPFDLAGGYRLGRAGEPADELQGLLDRFTGPEGDREVFARYWRNNLDVPHTIELREETVRLAPVKGFSMGGIATEFGGGGAPSNVHATGEAWYGLVVDSVTGKPFGSFLARGAVLAAELAERPAADLSGGLPSAPVAPGLTKELRDDIRSRLDAIKDHRFEVDAATSLIDWCRYERDRTADLAATDQLILTEAYVASVLTRQESRGFFCRPDFPETNPGYDGLLTVAAYDPDTRSVEVQLEPAGWPPSSESTPRRESSPSCASS